MRPTSLPFPPIEQALREPNGLLAVGGELSAERLACAYRSGIFPWYEAGQPVLWWSPDPRAVIKPANVHVSRSLRKSMRRMRYGLSMNKAFSEVMAACAEPREDDAGTWITPEMRAAYLELHLRGAAHSIEVWQGLELVGGLYGVALGKLFCGESMFSRRADTSKIAFLALCRLLQLRGWPLLDCQLPNPHLQSLGVNSISREQFKAYLPETADNVFQCGALSPLPWRDAGELEGSLH